MPVIAFSSPKGGCGKTTGAVILATVLAERGTSVAVIDGTRTGTSSTGPSYRAGQRVSRSPAM
jgi:cellulose biosynthesis protein BcsQ